MYCAVVHIVLIISLASRKHIESDDMDGTGDPPPMWPLLLIGFTKLSHNENFFVITKNTN